MKKKFLSLLLVLTMLLSSIAMLGITVGADEVSTKDDGVIENGEIWGVNDFLALENIDSRKITTDINIMVNELDFINQSDRTMLMINYLDATFNGDGNNDGIPCTIKNLIIDGSEKSSSGYMGLFYQVENGYTLKNLTLDSSCEFIGVSDDCNGIGALVGICKNGATLKNLTNNMAVGQTSKSYVGGILGVIATSGTYHIVGCKNNGNVLGNTYVGGIVGYISTSDSGVILNIDKCLNIGNVNAAFNDTSESNFAGGILGGRKNDSTNKTNTFTLNVENSATTGDLKANWVGGIVGRLSRDKFVCSINNCYVRGTLAAPGQQLSAFVTQMNTADGGTFTLHNSYVAATMYATSGDRLRVYASHIDNNVGDSENKIVGDFLNIIYDITPLPAGENGGYIRGCAPNHKLSSAKFSEFTAKTGAADVVSQMLSDGNLGAGKAFVEDTLNINDGYPIIAWQNPYAPKFAGVQESITPDVEGVRFVATIGDVALEDIAEVGFTVGAYYGGGQVKDFSKALNSVYTGIMENQTETTANSLGGTYVFAHGISGLEAVEGEITFKVMAYVKLADGTTYDGSIYQFTYNNGEASIPVVIG